MPRVHHVDSFLPSRSSPPIFAVVIVVFNTFFTARHILVRAVALDRCLGARRLVAPPPDGDTRIADLSLPCCPVTNNQKKKTIMNLKGPYICYL